MPRLAHPAVAGLVLLAACAAPKGSGAADSTPAGSPSPATSAGATTSPAPSPMPSEAQPPAGAPPGTPPAAPPGGVSAPAPNAPVAPPIAHPPAPGEGAPVAVPPDVQELWSGQQTQLRAARRIVVRDAAEWARVAAQLPGVPQPSIDWGTHMLVVAALGERPTGGHAVQVTGFTRGGGGATVTVTATRPGASCMTTQAVTAPAVVARVPKVSGEVTFVERSAVREC